MLALAAATALSGACYAGPDRAQEDGVTVRDSAGVALVHNAHQSPPSDCIVIAAEPKLTIAPSPTDGSGYPALYRVLGAALLDDGTIVLLNAGTRQLLFFSQSGEYQRAVGGEGRGPGEFVGPDWFGRGKGDTLFVWDTRLRRLSVFSGTGEFVTSGPVPLQMITVRGLFADGSFLADPISLVYIGGDGSLKRESKKYQRYDSGIDEANHLADGMANEWVDGENGPYSLPFGKSGLFAAHEMLLVVADNAAAVLRYYDLQGQLSRLVSWASDLIPVTDQDKRNYLEHHAPDFTGRERQRDNTLFADERPRFSAIKSSRTGWLWVREFAAAWEPPESWLVFDEDGSLQCRVEMPSRFSVREVGEDHIIGVQRNEFEEESVVLFNLNRNY